MNHSATASRVVCIALLLGWLLAGIVPGVRAQTPVPYEPLLDERVIITAFEDLLDEPAGPKTYKAIAERTMTLVGALGEEEKRLRAELLAGEVAAQNT